MTAIFRAEETSAVIDGRGQIFVLQEPNVAAALPGPPGPAGPAATIAVGTVTTGAAGSAASITNAGTSSAAVFNFTIPRGATGATGGQGPAATIAVGTVTTGAAGSSASVTNSGTSGAAVLDFTIPRGAVGATGTAATIAVGTVTTGAAGSAASITNAGTSSAAVFNFSIPRGATGATGTQGPAATIAVGTVTTGAPGSSATVTNVGTSGAAVFNFTIPRGADGTGTVTSVNVGGGTTGFTFTGGPITSSGILTMTVSDPATVRTAIGAAANTVATTSAAGLMSNTDKSKLDGIATGATANLGTVTSVGMSVPTGFSVSGSPVTASGTLAVTYAAGYVGYTTAEASKLAGIATGATANTGTVTSVAMSGGTTGLTFSGGPVTSNGTFTASGTLTIGSGGTGATTAAAARTALGLGTIATLAAPSGDVVGTTAIQTLPNKTLRNPTIDGYTEGMATASGTAFSPSLAVDTLFFYTTTGNATVTLPAPVAGKSFVVVVQYGGAHTLTWAGGAVRWPDGTPPTPTSVSGKRDTFAFICVDGATWQPGGMNI